MTQRKFSRTFTEAVGRTVESIEYSENAYWRALIIIFKGGQVLSFELGTRLAVRAGVLQKRGGNLEIIRKYGQISGDVVWRTRAIFA
jgi:hypothetical protein